MIRAMTPADLPAAVALLGEVGLGGAVGNLARYLAWQPACGWVAEAAGALVGTVTVLRQGDVGFVGCMAVAPARQGGGWGRRLLEHAHAAGRRAGLATFLLEATPSGERLYARLGYVATGETIVATRAPTGVGPAPLPPSALAEVLALDAAATGLARADMLRGLLAEGGPGALVPGAGYGLVVGDRLGPLVARDASAGHALFDALTPAAAIIGAPESAATRAALARHGFTEARRLRRMQLGAPPPAPPGQVWALASPGAG